MPKPNVSTLTRRGCRGFTLVEVMVSLALALIILAITFELLDQLYNVFDSAIAIAQVNQNLRSSVNLIARDLETAGAGIPLGGIPVPTGGTSTLIIRPGLVGYTFPPSGFLHVLSPGSGFGPTFGTTRPVPTDEITMIRVNPNSLLNAQFLTALTFGAGSATITFDPATNIGAGAARVRPGDLIMLSNTNSSCLLAATAVDTLARTVTFTQGDGNDVLGLNQFPPQATNGSIAALRTPGSPPTFPSTTAYLIDMITYYLDTTTPQKLKRLVGSAAPLSTKAQEVGRGINILQFTYDLANGTTVNQTNPATPNEIRKVNLGVTVRADRPSRKTKLYYANSVFTAVTIQNIAFLNKY